MHRFAIGKCLHFDARPCYNSMLWEGPGKEVSAMPHQRGIKPVAQNKKAYHDYFVEETYECGLCLKGTEVKSMRQGRVNLKESFAMVRGTEVFAEGMHISPMSRAASPTATRFAPKSCSCIKARSASSAAW